MKIILRFIVPLLLLAGASCTPNNEPKTSKNVIFMLVDGCSNGALTLSRWYKQYTQQTDEGLSFDPYMCGQMRACHINAPTAGSAGAMTTLMCGELVESPNIGLYPAPRTGNGPDADMYPADESLALRPLCSVLEAARNELGKRTGIVVTTYFCHATPAATAAHAVSRSEYSTITSQMASNLDLCFGGGIDHMTPKAREILEKRGVDYIEGDFDAFRSWDGERLWANLAPGGMGYEIDRSEAQPSLAEMTDKAIRTLSKSKKGFFLMVEGSAVDFAAHGKDPVGVVSEMLSFEQAVEVALDFARKDGNTTVVVTADHGTAGVVLGDAKYGKYSSWNIATALGKLPDIKASAAALAAALADAKPSEMAGIVKERAGIELTAEEERNLIEVSGKTESDYMQVGNTKNVQSEIGKIYSSRTHVGYSSGNHSGEDVFYAVFPKDNGRPEGFITNVQMNRFVQKALGLKTSLRELTDMYFAPAEEVLSSFETGVDKWGDPQIRFTLPDGTPVAVSAGSSLVTKGGESVELNVPAVCVSKSGKFYIPRNILKQLQ